MCGMFLLAQLTQLYATVKNNKIKSGGSSRHTSFQIITTIITCLRLLERRVECWVEMEEIDGVSDSDIFLFRSGL